MELGSDGRTKGVCRLTPQPVVPELDSLWWALGAEEHDTNVSWLPLHHDLGLVLFVFMPVHFGRPSHLLQPSFGNIRSWLMTIARVKGTFTAAPDFAYRAAARLGMRPDLSSLRFAANGGEPVRQSTIDAFEAAFGLGPVVAARLRPRGSHPRGQRRRARAAKVRRGRSGVLRSGVAGHGARHLG